LRSKKSIINPVPNIVSNTGQWKVTPLSIEKFSMVIRRPAIIKNIANTKAVLLLPIPVI
jgi:hypothetical protein